MKRSFFLLIGVCLGCLVLAHAAEPISSVSDSTRLCRKGVRAPKPLFRDPVYDGAADPVVIWNPLRKKWWMFYTNRRATQTELPGVSWVYKTPIGIAESADGAHWDYAGTAHFPNLPPECGGADATFWAPDVVRGDDQKWHMFLSIQPGVAEKWSIVQGFIAHLTSDNLRDWAYERRLELPARCYDADAIRMQDGTWRLYFKDPGAGSTTFRMMESTDLYTWTAAQEIQFARGEGPIAFFWKDYYWMIIDDWRGMTVFRSVDGNQWERQPGDSLMPDGQGTGTDDIPNALHGEIIQSNGRTYLFYFTHPGRVGADKQKDGYEQRRSSIQVVELTLNNLHWIAANRNQPTYMYLSPQKKNARQ